MQLKLLLACATIVFPDAGLAEGSGAASWRHEELRRFPADEANQGVAVDAGFFYAIDNHAIGKYRKDTGARVAGWEGGKGGPIKHLNAGVVLDGKLYCAHSNFPDLPEQSSVEIWDAGTMQHVGEQRFANPPGSLTWVDRRDGAWFACFAHYQKTSDPARTRVVKFDAEWEPLTGWTFPSELIQRFAGNSSSGGAFGPGGHLFVTGHDARELYVLEMSNLHTELQWRATIPISAAGQAFAWDPASLGVLYSIERKTREVIVSRITGGTTAVEEEGEPATLEALFDGKSFTGWEQKGNWVIEHGAMLRKDKGGDLTRRGALLRLQDHCEPVWFRHLRWREIPAEEKLARSEFTPIPPAALEKENARIEQMLKARVKQ